MRDPPSSKSTKRIIFSPTNPPPHFEDGGSRTESTVTCSSLPAHLFSNTRYTVVFPFGTRLQKGRDELSIFSYFLRAFVSRPHSFPFTTRRAVLPKLSSLTGTSVHRQTVGGGFVLVDHTKTIARPQRDVHEFDVVGHPDRFLSTSVQGQLKFRIFLFLLV